MKYIFTITLLMMLAVAGNGQYHTDTVHHAPASKFWGNSTYVAAGINLARNQEYEFNIGRTYGQSHHYMRGLFSSKTSTWGFGYSYSPALNGLHNIKTFYQHTNMTAFPWTWYTWRAEYFYTTTMRQHYFRPYVGIHLLYGVLSYNYSFLLNKNEGPNFYRHGLSFRLQHYFFRKNWFRTKTERR